MKRLSFPKSARLLKNGQFKAVLARNMRSSDRLLTVFMAENNLNRPRLGLSVAKALGPAGIRNRLKRLIREAFRKNQHDIPQSFDYLVMTSARFTESAKASGPEQIVKKMTFEQVENSLLKLVNRIGQNRTRKVQ